MPGNDLQFGRVSAPYGRWLNIWDKDDPIAWPVEALMDTPQGKQYAEDTYIDVSDFVGKAHDRYWRSKKVHKIIAERW